MKDFFEKIVRSILVQSAKDLVKKVIKKNIEKRTVKGTAVVQKAKSHPWRQCPIGEHWVVTHPMKVPVSKKSPVGFTSREGHCALNPKRNIKVILMK